MMITSHQLLSDLVAYRAQYREHVNEGDAPSSLLLNLDATILAFLPVHREMCGQTAGDGYRCREFDDVIPHAADVQRLARLAGEDAAT